jgi:L-arabinokinase
MGELMYLSHTSYSACGLGSAGTDRIAEMVREAGYHEGLFGARITGGGSGGTVAILASNAAADAVRGIARQYAQESGLAVTVFEGSSDGMRLSN